jgi:hypothetical protein
MKAYRCLEAAMFIGKLQNLMTGLKRLSLKNPGEPVKAERLGFVEGLLVEIKKYCKETDHNAHEFKNSYETADSAVWCVRRNNPPLTTSALHSELRHVMEGIFRDMLEHWFAYVPRDLSKYFAKERPFGEAVYQNFPKARAEATEAGNCLALDCNTAAVFHLMRVAEYGLRSIAKKVNVTLTHKGQNQPIEYADWDKVITGVQNKITAMRQLSHGKVREQNLNFYSDAADHCSYVKDIWRNTVSHTRRPYNAAEALAVWQRVEQFMGKLATDLRRAR